MDTSSNEGTTTVQQPQNLDLPNPMSIIKTNSFNSTFLDSPVFFLVTKFKKSLMIWIGGIDGKLDNLAYSATTPYDKGIPAATDLLSVSLGETTSSSIASKLTKRLGKPVFVSVNPQSTPCSLFQVFILSKILDEIERNPCNF